MRVCVADVDGDSGIRISKACGGGVIAAGQVRAQESCAPTGDGSVVREALAKALRLGLRGRKLRGTAGSAG